MKTTNNNCDTALHVSRRKDDHARKVASAVMGHNEFCNKKTTT